MLAYLAQLRRMVCFAVGLAVVPAATAEMAAEQLKRLRDTRLDPARCYRVRDLFLEREDVKFYFTDGHLLFATPFDGTTIAAFFVATAPADEGEIILIPPTERERKSLARFTEQPILNEKFRTAMLFFTDGTADVLRAQLAESPSSRLDPEAGHVLAPNWTPVLQNIFDGLALRTLIDMNSAAGPSSGYFTAAVAGGKRGRFDVTIDHQVPDDNVSVGQVVWDDNRRFYEIWCQFPGRSRRDGQRPNYEIAGRLENFHIETHLSPSLHMQVSARATLLTEKLESRIIAFELSRYLRLTEVRVDGDPVEFLQFEEFGSSGIARRLNDLVAIVLPEEPSAAPRYAVEFRYEGTVISQAGDRVFYVGSRGSWYPKRDPGFTHFELLFQYPDDLDLVATGRQVESSSENGVRTTRFRTTAPIRLAGFNLGDYERESRQIGPYTVEVCANKGIEAGLQPPPRPPTLWIDPAPPDRRRPRPAVPVLAPQPEPKTPAPTARLAQIVDHSASAIEFFHDRLGPLSVSNVVISPIPGGFGQGFPGLVYASTLSYYTPRDAPLKEYSPSQQLFFSELLRTHEIAHQWWGNLVATQSTADVWLTEALATYSALLFLEDHLGAEARDQVLAEYRDRLLAPNDSGEAVEAAGAIVLGERLRSSQFPNATRVIVYEKGAWIVHMLRGMMGDSSFLAFLRRLCESYRLAFLTTEDFQKEAVRFLPRDWPDPTLENFFDQWVYGTGIPSLDVVYSVKGKSPQFRLTGRLLQKSVPESFSVLVPVEIHTLPGRSLTKWIPTEGNSTEFSIVLQNKPTRVVIDPTRSVLLRPRS